MAVRRTLIELLHIATGVGGAALFAYAGVWSMRHAADTIWHVAYGVMIVMVLIGLPPLWQAWRADRRDRSRRG